MWQKLNRIDIQELIKARTQLINAVRLVSAASRTYLTNSQDDHSDWLTWDKDTASIVSKEFGRKEVVNVTLDIEQFVLSLHGHKDHIEHLVLSGLTYPMAFGWMKIKLDSFGLNGEIYNDESTASIDNILGVDAEMHVTDQEVFNNLVIYFSNAYSVLEQLKKKLNIQGRILINPATLCLELNLEDSEDNISFGFSLGDNLYLTPYFYLKVGSDNKKDISKPAETIGIWNNKNWYGLVFLADEFITLDPDQEQKRVMNFFTKNYHSIIQP